MYAGVCAKMFTPACVRLCVRMASCNKHQSNLLQRRERTFKYELEEDVRNKCLNDVGRRAAEANDREEQQLQEMRQERHNALEGERLAEGAVKTQRRSKGTK